MSKRSRQKRRKEQQEVIPKVKTIVVIKSPKEDMEKKIIDLRNKLELGTTIGKKGKVVDLTHNQINAIKVELATCEDKLKYL